MIIVSACLCGIPCRYDGSHNLHPVFASLVEQGKAYPVCPEQLGNLPTPREPSEIVGGNGNDVLQGRASVMTKEAMDVTSQFIVGAEAVLALAHRMGSTRAILKSRSPSCGLGEIYDGTFTHHKCVGDGVTAALLKKHGIEVINDEDYRSQLGNERNKGASPA